MKPSLSTWISESSSVLSTENGRRRAVVLALNLSEDTPLAPSPYEQLLLERFVQGDLTLEEVLLQLETRGHR